MSPSAPARTLEQHLLRYREIGDPADLGAAFDATAPVLESGWSIAGVLVSMSFELWSQWDDWRLTRETALHAGRRTETARRLGLNEERFALSPAHFRRPGGEQLSLL